MAGYKEPYSKIITITAMGYKGIESEVLKFIPIILGDWRNILIHMESYIDLVIFIVNKISNTYPICIM